MMTEHDRLLTALWIVAVLGLGIIANAMAVLDRARGDERHLELLAARPVTSRHMQSHHVVQGHKMVGRIVGRRPAGCPHRYCACALALKLFGRIIPTLNLSDNWLRFPRAAPAPQMVAARRGHVMLLLEHRGGSAWLTYDPNSGGGLSRVHVQSIADYAIVNPHAASLAALEGAR